MTDTTIYREESPPSIDSIEENLLKKTSIPVVICGPSGSGKSCIINLIIQRNPDVFETSISWPFIFIQDFTSCHQALQPLKKVLVWNRHLRIIKQGSRLLLMENHYAEDTTRPRRPDEISGKDYFFISRTEFESAIKRGNFIEYAIFSGNYYGTSKDQLANIMQKGKICIMELDTQGVEQIRKTHSQSICIFIRPRNYATLESRLRTNSVESEDYIQQRLAVAHHEMTYSLDDEIFTKVIINDKLETAVSEIEIFLKKDKRLKKYFKEPWMKPNQAKGN